MPLALVRLALPPTQHRDPLGWRSPGKAMPARVVVGAGFHLSIAKASAIAGDRPSTFCCPKAYCQPIWHPNPHVWNYFSIYFEVDRIATLVWKPQQDLRFKNSTEVLDISTLPKVRDGWNYLVALYLVTNSWWLKYTSRLLVIQSR